MLNRVQTDGGTSDQRTIFYTGLYHMFLSPNIFSDGNGDYIGFDKKVRRLPAGQANTRMFPTGISIAAWCNFKPCCCLHNQPNDAVAGSRC